MSGARRFAGSSCVISKRRAHELQSAGRETRHTPIFRARSASTTGPDISPPSAWAIVLLPLAILPPTHTIIGRTSDLRPADSASRKDFRASVVAFNLGAQDLRSSRTACVRQRDFRSFRCSGDSKALCEVQLRSAMSRRQSPNRHGPPHSVGAGTGRAREWTARKGKTTASSQSWGQLAVLAARDA